MLLYIIDGFNVVHKIKNLKASAKPHQDLVNYIKRNKLTGSRNNKVLIVFDGNMPFGFSRDQDFEVIFSQDESADEIIKRKLYKLKNKTEAVIVSDDREIKDAAKREGAKICPVYDFIAIKKKKEPSDEKQISYVLQQEITDQMRKIWL